MMEGFYGWIRSIVGFLCIFTLAMQLLPSGNFKKYVRFFGGLLFLILVLGPLGNFLELSEHFESLFRLESIRLELEEMKITGEGVEQLREKAIQSSYEEEIARQIRETAEGRNLTVQDVEVQFDLTSQKIRRITVQLREEESSEWELLKRDLQQAYQVEETHINIRG